jgi:hypothetical protein
VSKTPIIAFVVNVHEDSFIFLIPPYCAMKKSCENKKEVNKEKESINNPIESQYNSDTCTESYLKTSKIIDPRS